MFTFPKPETLKALFYFTATISSIVVLLQFGYTIKWNKKQLTLKMLDNLNQKLKEHFEFLHETFNYRDLTKPLTPDDIHKKMGIFLEDAGKTIDDCNKDRVVNISKRKFEYYENGKEIQIKLKNFLNDLEEFCAAVNDGTLDEKQSKRLMRGIIVRASKYFQPYIEHLRNDHLEVSEKAYRELLDLGNKWSHKSLLNQFFNK